MGKTPTGTIISLMQTLSAEMSAGLIKGAIAHNQELIRRFDKAPKPMAYQRSFCFVSGRIFE